MLIRAIFGSFSAGGGPGGCFSPFPLELFSFEPFEPLIGEVLPGGCEPRSGELADAEPSSEPDDPATRRPCVLTFGPVC